MKKVLFVLVIGILTACSSNVDNPETKEGILNQISEYKKEVIELNKKITDLEKDLFEIEGVSKGTPVYTSVMEHEQFNHYFEVNGSVEAINAAYISPEINGQVKEIYVKEGQNVNKGQILLKINSSITESSIREVETALELANTVYEKQKQLWDKNIGSELDYLQAKNNKESLESRLETLNAQIDMTLVNAPISGIVDKVLVKDGELAIPGMQLIQIINLDGLYINADVSESYISKVKKGDIVSLEFPSLPDINMDVPVYRTGNTVKTANRTFVVQLKIDNVDNMIKPNVLAKIKINDYTKDKAIIVPSIILKQDMQGTYLYTAIDGRAKKVYIETGKSYKGNTLVLSGLEVGDEVIVDGYNQVSDGKLVSIL